MTRGRIHPSRVGDVGAVLGAEAARWRRTTDEPASLGTGDFYGGRVILTSPTWRAIEEDAQRERGTWSPTAWMVRMGIQPADANAYANVNAYADANADADANDANAYDVDANVANADAHTHADADVPLAYAYDADASAYADAMKLVSLSGGKHVKPGLYLFGMPSGSLQVLRVGWIRRVEGDEYEILHSTTPLRAGDYKTQFADVAIDGPPKNWTWTRCMPRPSPLNRFHCLGPVSLDPKQFTKVCPMPDGWEE